jgi:hypothetical protein
MNNIDIDALSGRELDIAVHKELSGDTITFLCADGIHVVDWFEREIILKHYSSNIAAAWELDGDGWEWSSDDAVLHEVDGKTMEVSVYIGPKSYNGLVKWSTMSEKAAAYATARCRAWLKAKYAERGADNGA